MAEHHLYWLVYWDGHQHHVGPHRAETRELATRHGLEHEPGLQLKAVISHDMNLTVPQMLELAELLPPPWISDVEAAGGTNAKPAFPPLGDSPERVPG